jgi:hypothetical protein
VNAEPIEVLATRPRPSVTALPEEFVSYFNAKGMQIFLAYNASISLASARVYGRTPVFFEDLPSDLQKLAAAVFDSPTRNNGLLIRGDCCLMQQSIEERNAWRHEEELRRRDLESDDRFYDFQERIQKLAQEGNAPGMAQYVHVNPKDMHPLSAHVSGGRNEAAGREYEKGAQGKK